jgi:hypothetical protein
MGIRAYYVNGLSNESSDKSGKGDAAAPVAPADNVLMHAIYYSDLNAATGQWSTRKPIYLENVLDGNLVDPNLVQLQDGRYVMTYMRGNFGQANPEQVPTIYSAWSYDGVYFFDPQVLFKPASSNNADGSPVVTDPSLVQLKDGSWLLAVSNPSAASATLYASQDGLNFTAKGVTLATFSPDLQVLPDGRVRIHYADGPAGGIASKISADGGQTWTNEAGVRKSGAGFDPSVFQLADGSWRMLFKTQSPTTDPSASPIFGHKTSLASSTDGASFSTAQSEFAASASVGEGIDFVPLTVTQSLLAAAASNDQIAVGGTGAHVRAGAGRDTVVFTMKAEALALSADVFNRGDWVGSLKAAPGTKYLLQDVERLQFSDRSIALDLDGNAGKVARILGAVLGAQAVRNAEYVGIGIDLLDGGTGYDVLAAMAMSAVGKTTAADICSQLWLNLTGSAATPADIAPFVAMLDKGELSVGALTVLAANADINAANIGLVGLAQTGLEFL